MARLRTFARSKCICILSQVSASEVRAAAPAPVTVVRERRGGLPAWLQIAAMFVIGAGIFAYAQRMQTRVSNLEAQLRSGSEQDFMAGERSLLGRTDIDAQLLADLIRSTKKLEAEVTKLVPPED